MADPIRLQIIDGFYNTLLLVRKQDGYNNTFAKVSRNFKSIDQISRDEFPFVCLQIGTSLYTPMTADQYTSGRFPNDLDGWQIGVVAYKKIDGDGDDFHIVTEKLIKDIIDCIGKNFQLGLPNIVTNTYLDTIFDPIAVIGEEGRISDLAIQIIFKVKYDFNKKDS